MRFIALLACVATAALIAAGCGGGDDKTATAQAQGASSETSSAQEDTIGSDGYAEFDGAPPRGTVKKVGTEGTILSARDGVDCIVMNDVFVPGGSEEDTTAAMDSLDEMVAFEDGNWQNGKELAATIKDFPGLDKAADFSRFQYMYTNDLGNLPATSDESKIYVFAFGSKSAASGFEKRYNKIIKPKLKSDAFSEKNLAVVVLGENSFKNPPDPVDPSTELDFWGETVKYCIKDRAKIPEDSVYYIGS